MINKKVLTAGAGLLAGVLGGKVLSSKLAKNAAVSTVAGGLRVKESLDKTIEKVRVSADDIVAEAKEKKEKEDLETAKKAAEMDINQVAKEDLIADLKAEIKEEILRDMKAEEEENK